MLTAGGLLFAVDDRDSTVAVAVVDQLDVHAGDGHDFEINLEIESATGQQFPVLNQRGGWFQISLPGSKPANDKMGWVHQSQVETITGGESFLF